MLRAERKSPFFSLHTGEGATCAHDAHPHEMVRRLMEEFGIAFEAAATANLLIITMHMRTAPTTTFFSAQAFQQLGTLDIMHEATENAAHGGTVAWAIAADAGNKGRETDI
eukprot:4891991-Pleurochrysis_carterae.AAC.1